MPSADQAKGTTATGRTPPASDVRRRASAKGAATVQRHRQERRAERLAQIRAQTKDGTLIIRHMPSDQPPSAPAPTGPSSEPTHASAVSSAQQRERHRIADGVHDDSLQALCAVGLGLANLRRQVGEGTTGDALERLQATVRLASQRLRSLVFELSPPELENQGLVAALRAYLKHVQGEDGLHFTLDDHLSATPDPDTRAFLFRAAQELLMNVRKHAHASHVDVSVTTCEGRHVIRVRDDGDGFNAVEALRARAGHVGLAALAERLELAGGALHIESAIGAGATVEFEVPAHSPPPGS
jgi:signal transduction histidine kinase